MREKILQALKTVQDPDLNRDIVSLGFVKDLKIAKTKVSFTLELTTPACPVKEQLKQACETALLAIDGIDAVDVNITARVRGPLHQIKTKILPQVKNTIAIASGKGGVGKSTVSANVAVALSKTGAAVGLLDCDIYGPSIHMMFNLVGQRPNMTSNEMMEPLQSYGIKILSMGLLSDDDKPVIWRGPMVHNVIQQFLKNVAWGELDYLIIDLPPGTGDAQLSLSQESALTGAVIVTTPQDVSLLDARKGLKMFEQLKVPVLGIVENMSFFVCDGCGKRTEIFRHGGGKKASKDLNVPFLGEIPIDPQIVLGGDKGKPIVQSHPDSSAAQALTLTAQRIAQQISIAGFASNPAQELNLTWK